MSIDHHSGGCACGRVRYRLLDTPLIVHACHCRMCQRLSGGTNAVNAVIEAAKVELLTGETFETEALTPSGHGQVITRCAACHVAIWSEYRVMKARTGVALKFVRAGTLDDPRCCPPDVHIFSDTMQPHAVPGAAKPVYPAFYDLSVLWPEVSLTRLSRARARPFIKERAPLREM